MRILLALAVAALALVAWLAFVPQRAAVHEVSVNPARSTSSAGEQATALEPASTAEAQRRAPGIATVHSPTASGATGSCRIHGRVVDDRDFGIHGACVQLREWGSFPDVLAVHETTTGPTGAFELVLPLPTSARQSLIASAEPFHVPNETWYGLERLGVIKHLTAGDVDAGRVVLQACGIVTGRVVEGDAQPVAGLWVRLLCEGRTPAGANTDANGSFEVRGLLPGRWLVTIKDEDWLMPPELFVEVQARAAATAPDLVLERAPTIAGTVVETDGTPIPFISVSGSKTPGNPIVWTKSLADGTFELRLTLNAPMRLSVEAQDAFGEFACAREDTRCTFEPWTRDVRIVLERAPLVTLRIVDGETGASIESFGCRIERLDGTERFGRTSGRLEPIHHTHGTVAIPLPCRTAFLVAAPGYARRRVIVELGAGAQTIALDRASSITGCVLVDGKPTAGARVFGVQGELSIAGKPGARAFNPSIGPENPLATTTNESGEFTLEGLAADTYALRLSVDGGVTKTIESLSVPRAGVLALGDVELARGATLRVLVRTAPGDSPIGFRVNLITRDYNHTESISSADGRYEFTGLAGGRHHLSWWRGLSPLVRHDEWVDVPAGQSREFVIDATSSGLCTLRIHVEKNARPGANVAVSTRVPGGVHKGTAFLGYTNENGDVVGQVDGGLRVLVEASSPQKQKLAAAAAPIDTVAGGEVSCTIDIRVGTLMLELPATLAPPEEGRVTLEFESGTTITAYSSSGPSFGIEWDSNQIDFGEVPAGSQGVAVRFERHERDLIDKNPKAGRWIELREPFRARVEIVEGKATRLVVP